VQYIKVVDDLSQHFLRILKGRKNYTECGGKWKTKKFQRGVYLFQ